MSSEKITDGDKDEILGSQLALVGATIPLNLRRLLEDIVPVRFCAFVAGEHRKNCG